MQTPLRLKLRPSRWLAALLLVLHAAALGALWPLTFPFWVRLAIAAALAASLVRGLRGRALLRSPDAVVEMDFRDDGRLGLVRRDGVCVDADVHPGTAVYGCAVLLQVRVAGEWRPRSVIVLADSLDAEGFRRLRIWLRWKRPFSAA